MRIVGGDMKGRAIAAPKGRGTRPTSDRAREALFNVLMHAAWAPDLQDARVIDLYAGTGALGFEAISRGAAFCLFVETDHNARGAIRTNIDAFNLFGVTKIHRRSAASLGEMPSSVGAPFDLAFLDPPYNKGLIEPALDGLKNGGWLKPDAIAIVEMAQDEALSLDGWALLDERTYGAAKINALKQAN